MAIDMPGVADAPLAGIGERRAACGMRYSITSRAAPTWTPSRIGIHGGSTGGYWATKVAHTHHERLRAAVNQGGPAHFAFRKDWIVKAQRGEYPFELAETLACAFGRSPAKNGSSTRRNYRFSTQGILDQPCAPLLCVNGIERFRVSHR